MSNVRNMIAAAALGFIAIPAAAQTATPPDRAYERELMADASRRSEIGTGHDANGFFIGGNDNFRLNIGGDVQFRYTANFADDDGIRDGFEGGFSSPLTRLRFSGNANNLDFMLVGAFDEDNGEANLEDAFIGHGFGSNRVQFGQFRLPFLREVNVDERYQLAAGRSVVAETFGQGRSQGIQASTGVDNFILTGAFSDGFNTANTDFNDPAEADYGLTVRADWIVMGSSEAFRDFTALNTNESSLLLGAAGHYQDGDVDRFYTFTGDASYENNRFNAFTAAVGRNIEDDSTNDWFDWGGVAQAGYLITDNTELFGRWDVVVPDDDRDISDNYNFLTVGANYYLAGQAAKFTGDLVYAVDDTEGLDGLTDFSNIGLLGSQDSGEFALRFQFQLLF